ncbi:hypothetical protein [Rhizobacter sp. Root1221]|uniref:hypothetical protein n=1 Tax=Rhizobacter sp. Root1221 TaxID=1736433 RepID=UPI0006FF4264|nr:hypothetical protein [Rhizobacter sp. Root1221]KQW01217.1 hypothetical protein ASC87_15105 [Rhizobacter sp. Root1221]
MKVLDRTNDELQTAPEGETPEAEAKIERDLAAVTRERKKLITIRKNVLVQLDFIEKPAANEMVRTLTELTKVNGPQQTDSPLAGVQNAVIRGNKKALRDQAHLQGKRDELISTQGQVRQALKSGAFNGLPPDELEQMRELATLNIDSKLEQVSQLKEMVRQTDQKLKAMGAGGGSV